MNKMIQLHNIMTEADELRKKSELLENFIGSREFFTLKILNRQLLRGQHAAMLSYLSILESRILLNDGVGSK